MRKFSGELIKLSNWCSRYLQSELWKKGGFCNTIVIYAEKI